MLLHPSFKGLGRVRGLHERAQQRGAAGEHQGEAGAGLGPGL